MDDYKQNSFGFKFLYFTSVILILPILLHFNLDHLFFQLPDFYIFQKLYVFVYLSSLFSVLVFNKFKDFFSRGIINVYFGLTFTRIVLVGISISILNIACESIIHYLFLFTAMIFIEMALLSKTLKLS